MSRSGRWSGLGLRDGWKQRQFLGDIQSGHPDELANGRGIQTRSIEFHADCPFRRIKGDSPDTVDVPCSGQCKGHGLIRWRCKSEEDFNRGHAFMISRLGMCRAALKRLEKGSDLRIGPVSSANVFAADMTAAVDDVGFRPHVGFE
jgi:hypothetical protein